LHLVNYNRTEPEKKRSPGSGIVDEKPIACEPFAVDLAVPAGFSVRRVEAMTPEEPARREVPFKAVGQRVRFSTPQFLVYAVVRLELARQ
jgi:hypothetical protein